MPPGLLFHLLSVILWVGNSSRAHVCSRLCQLRLLGWRVPGGPVSEVLVLAVLWGALVSSTWPFSLQMFSHYSVVQPKLLCLVAGF